MKLNKTTDYAIRIIKTIYHEGGIVTSKAISIKEEMSQGVLMKIMRTLRSHGIVESHQGRGEVSGGFSLRKSPKELTLLDIVEAMEGPIMIAEWIDSDQKLVATSSLCREYDRINNSLKEELQKYTLYEIFEKDRNIA